MTASKEARDELREILRTHYGDAPIDVVTKLFALFDHHAREQRIDQIKLAQMNHLIEFFRKYKEEQPNADWDDFIGVLAGERGYLQAQLSKPGNSKQPKGE